MLGLERVVVPDLCSRQRTKQVHDANPLTQTVPNPHGRFSRRDLIAVQRPHEAS